MPRIGVVLSGCGFMDGAEIHEATLTLLHLDDLGVDIVCMAPDTDNIEVVDHNKKQATGETRNVYAESGRIARGDIIDIANADFNNLDAVIFPGGFGAAKNLCNWAVLGAACEVNSDVEKLILDCYNAKKPLGFICIAPVLAAKVLGDKGVSITIGTDQATAEAIEATGAKHIDCAVDGYYADEEHRVASTPAYMLGPSISHVNKGIKKLVDKVVEWA